MIAGYRFWRRTGATAAADRWFRDECLLKTQQKISGRLASDDVTRDRLEPRSYIDTATSTAATAFVVLHDLMSGSP